MSHTFVWIGKTLSSRRGENIETVRVFFLRNQLDDVARKRFEMEKNLFSQTSRRVPLPPFASSRVPRKG